MRVYESYEEIPESVQDFLLSFADAEFITDIPLEQINEWLAEHLEAFKILGGMYD
jgi:hypothetical protein